jgi:hypothetical protein
MWPTPQAWDVLLCRFPLVETPSEPATKVRPALVIGVELDEDGIVYVDVVYATTQKMTPIKIGEFIVDSMRDTAASKAAGLVQTTKFILTRHAELAYNSQFFSCAQGRQSPLLGRFSRTMQQRAIQTLAELRKR